MSSQFSLWSLAALVIAAVLASWLRGRENRKSQRIKDLRAKLDAIIEDLDSVEDLSVSYFLKPTNDIEAQQNGLQIKAKIKRVGERINSIHIDPTINQASKSASLLTKVVQFRQVVTLENFDSANRKPLAPQDPKFDQISKSSSEIKRALEALYLKNQ